MMPDTPLTLLGQAPRCVALGKRVGGVKRGEVAYLKDSVQEVPAQDHRLALPPVQSHLWRHAETPVWRFKGQSSDLAQQVS